MMRFCVAVCIGSIALPTAFVRAFQIPVPEPIPSLVFGSANTKSCLHSYTNYQGESTYFQDGNEDVNIFLESNYPEYHGLLSRNKEIWNQVKASAAGSTFFAPSAQAFQELGDKKQTQMLDDRNSEAVEKMAAYHVIAEEALGEESLLTEDWTKPIPPGGAYRPLKIEAILTLGGAVPVGRSKKGGFFGFGGTEEQKIVIGQNARIIRTTYVGNSVVHEVDEFISPELLWRYFDQVRLPGI